MLRWSLPEGDRGFGSEAAQKASYQYLSCRFEKNFEPGPQFGDQSLLQRHNVLA